MGSYIILLLFLRPLVDTQDEWKQTEEPRVLRGFHRAPEANIVEKPTGNRRGEYGFSVTHAIPRSWDGIIGEAPELERLKREVVDKLYGNGAKEMEIQSTAVLQSSGDSYQFTGKPLIALNPESSPENFASITSTSAERNDGSAPLFTSDNAGSIRSGSSAQNNPLTEANIGEISDGSSDKTEATLAERTISADRGNRAKSKPDAEETALKSNPSSSSSVTVNTKNDDTSIHATSQTSEVHGHEEKPLLRNSDLSEPNEKVDEADIASSHPISEETLSERNINLTISKTGSTNNHGSSDYLEN